MENKQEQTLPVWQTPTISELEIKKTLLGSGSTGDGPSLNMTT